MILFIGDSFTWGQGLHYYYLTEHKGWSWEDCQKYVENNRRFEELGFDADEFRRKNSFPYLVSKELDVPFQTPRFENGSDNQVTYNILETLSYYCTPNSIPFVIIQFSSPSRSIDNGNEPKFSTIEQNIKYQVTRISNILEAHTIDWLGISWQTEIGEILKNNYPENHIPIEYKNFKYSSFEDNNLLDLFISTTESVQDGHFNLEGHRVIADSIINKVKSRKDLIYKIETSKKDLNDFIFGV
jgi:hypothetical protein